MTLKRLGKVTVISWLSFFCSFPFHDMQLWVKLTSFSVGNYVLLKQLIMDDEGCNLIS